MPDDGKREGPIAFRMDKEDYKRFDDYVKSTDVGKSKIAERAMREYLEDQDEPTVPQFVSAGMLATIASVGLFALFVALPVGTVPSETFIFLFLMMGYAAVAFSVFFIRKLSE